MPFHDYNKRDYELPSGCKDLADVIKRDQALAASLPPEPPITRRVTLPEMVSVRYVAQISGRELHSILADMVELRIIISVDRSMTFADAARILGRYGIGADKAG